MDGLGSNLKFIGDVGRNNTEPFNDVYSEYLLNSSMNSHYLYTTNSVSDYYTGQLDWTQKLKRMGVKCRRKIWQCQEVQFTQGWLL